MISGIYVFTTVQRMISCSKRPHSSLVQMESFLFCGGQKAFSQTFFGRVIW